MHENYWFCYWKHLEEPRHQALPAQGPRAFSFLVGHFWYSEWFSSWPGRVVRVYQLYSWVFIVQVKWRSYLPYPPPWPHEFQLLISSLRNCLGGFKYGSWLHTWALGPTYEFCNHSLILVSSVLLVKLWEPQVQAPITRELLYHVTEDGNLRKPFPQLNLSSLKSLLLCVCHRNEKTNIIFFLKTAPKSLEVNQLCQMRPAYYIQRAISSDLTTFGCLKPATLPPRAEKTTNSTHTHTNLAQCGYCLYTTVWKTTCLLLAF